TNQPADSKTIEIDFNDMSKILDQGPSENDWIVGTINVSEKFKGFGFPRLKIKKENVSQLADSYKYPTFTTTPNSYTN
ncbi:4583_t:CDS:2, partial [Entrophospora sp. SA101]